MNSLSKKIVELLPAFEARGTIYLFALVEREDVNLYDVVVSSAWSDHDEAAAIGVLAEALVERLKPDEMTMLSRIVVILSSDSEIHEMPWSLKNVSPEDEKAVEGSFLGLDVRRAFIFKSQRPLVEAPAVVGSANI